VAIQFLRGLGRALAEDPGIVWWFRDLTVLSATNLSQIPASVFDSSSCRTRTLAKKLELRSVTPEEERKLRRLAGSRTEPARLVQRAKILVTMLDEPQIGAMAVGRWEGLSGETGCAWVRRFNAGGLEVLEDEPRGGRPPTHSPEVRSALMSRALQKPRSLGLPFELWTLERLEREFKAGEGGTSQTPRSGRGGETRGSTGEAADLVPRRGDA
jgi:hypothetical protein